MMRFSYHINSGDPNDEASKELRVNCGNICAKQAQLLKLDLLLQDGQEVVGYCSQS